MNNIDKQLLEAAKAGDINKLKAALFLGANLNVQNEYGNTPLHFAAWEGGAYCVAFLLKYGANPDVQNELGNTPLHDAAWKGHADCVEFLLKHGANPDVQNKCGKTPLHDAVRYGYKECAELLKNYKHCSLPDELVINGYKYRRI